MKTPAIISTTRLEEHVVINSGYSRRHPSPSLQSQRDGNLHRSDGPPARRGRVMQPYRSLHHRIKYIII